MAVARNQAIELLRIASAFGIVWFHARVFGGEFAGGGLIVFVVLSTLFISGRQGQSPGPLMLLRFLVPWAAWMVIYGLFNLRRGMPMVPMDHGLVPGILMGSSIHLWFLPFIAVVVALIVLAKRLMPPLVLASLATVGLGVSIVAIPWWFPWSLTLPMPFTQYMHVLPAVLAGTALGAIRYPQQNQVWGIGITVAVALIAFLPADGAIAYTVGIIALAIALQPKVQDLFANMDVTPVSRAMFGVYVLHPLALYPLWRFVAAGYGPLVVVVAFLASLAVVLVTKRLAPPVSAVLFAY